MVTQFQRFLLISRLTSIYFTSIVDYSLAIHRNPSLGSISNVRKTNMYQRKAGRKFIQQQTGVFPLKSNKRSWSKTRVHFVLVKVHERHYERKRDVFDPRFEFVPPILIKHREESTDGLFISRTTRQR